jgi:hypothetical protein
MLSIFIPFIWECLPKTQKNLKIFAKNKKNTLLLRPKYEDKIPLLLAAWQKKRRF